MKTYRGFILIMTLCILFVMSALVLALMHHVLLYHKTVNRHEKLSKRFYLLEQKTKLLGESWRLHSNCIQFKLKANGMIQRLIKGEGCAISEGPNHYRYGFEDLGNFPCLVMSVAGQKKTTHHIRLTVLLLGDEEYSSTLLQLRIIMPSSVTRKHCEKEEHLVKGGVSSWRYLNYLNVIVPAL